VPDLTSGRWQQSRSDTQVLAAILDGRGRRMPAFRGKVSEEQARAVVAFIRQAGPARPQAAKAMPEPSSLQQLLGWLGRFHPASVHFPVALLVAAAAAELLLFLTGRAAFDAASRVCVWFGGLTAPPAAALGWFLAGVQLTDPNWVLAAHRWLGTATAVCAVVVLVLSEVSRRTRPSARATFRLTLLLNAVLVLATGFFGGALIHGLDYYAWPL
jgi:uncharacterized membrane protein